jgi:hypothetical protein
LCFPDQVSPRVDAEDLPPARTRGVRLPNAPQAIIFESFRPISVAPIDYIEEVTVISSATVVVVRQIKEGQAQGVGGALSRELTPVVKGVLEERNLCVTFRIHLWADSTVHGHHLVHT